MKEKNRPKKKVYRSAMEFEKDFLPIFYEKNLAKERGKETKIIGTGLAKEFLKGIRQQLNK